MQQDARAFFCEREFRPPGRGPPKRPRNLQKGLTHSMSRTRNSRTPIESLAIFANDVSRPDPGGGAKQMHLSGPR